MPLGGELALPACELIQLAQRVLDLRAVLAGIEGRLGALVLILLGVELEIEQARQVAPRGIDGSAATAAGAEGHLDLAERGLRAQQMLQCLLLFGNGDAPLLLGELLRRRSHRRSGRLHLVLEASELLVRSLQIAHAETARE